MKGIILAGGQGTRLRPITAIINKHLLPVGSYPMIHYAVEKLREAGISEVVLITGRQSAGLFVDYLGSGERYNLNISYRIQPEAGGIAQALAMAEPLMRPGESMAVLLGDNLFTDSLKPHIVRFDLQNGERASVFLKEVADPRRYGVPTMKDGRITHIEEKPAHPKSRYCVTGIYLYDAGVFDRIRRIRPSGRGEMEITDVNNTYARDGFLSYNILQGDWIDAGTIQSLHDANRTADLIRREGDRA